MESQKQSVIGKIKQKKELIAENSHGEIPVARIDFLSFSGKVCSSEEYVSEQEFLKAVYEELHYGVPLNVILYRDQEGKSISRKFLEKLDTLPKSTYEEELPQLQRKKKTIKITQQERV